MEKFNPEQYTKYEKARILGARALQISANAPILVKLTKEDLEKLNFDPVKIAEIEFEKGVLPITVKRPLPKKVERKAPEIREIIKEESSEKETTKEGLPEERAKVEEEEEKEMEEEELTEEEIAEEFGKEESEEG